MVRKLVITLILILFTTVSANAESLFRLGTTTQGYNAAPKSLYTGVRAMSIGDMVSIVINENIATADNMTFNSDRSSETVDNFTTLIKNFFKFKAMDDVNGFGGSNTVDSTAGASRTMTFGDTISAQVVQLQANGNLVVQGKKSIVNGNERMDLIVSGVVDPRWINATGQIKSSQVSNLQFGLSGRGSISRGQNEGIINRFIRYLF